MKHTLTFTLLAALALNASGAPNFVRQPEKSHYDVVICGDSSGAVVAAVSAKREGRSVIWPAQRQKAMSASGLPEHYPFRRIWK